MMVLAAGVQFLPFALAPLPALALWYAIRPRAGGTGLARHVWPLMALLLAGAVASAPRAAVRAGVTVADARPEAVAAVMFDISEQPRWMDSIVQTVLETPGLLRKGSVIRQTLRVSGQDLVAKLVVVELVPYERLLLQVIVRHAELFDLFEVQPHDPGGSIVTYSGRHQLSRLNAVLTGWRLPALRRSFAARRTANLDRLRTLVHPAPLARRA